MRIAQVSPLQYPVPPLRYGGIQRVAHYLTEGLAELGHEVTLFAADGSATAGRLVEMGPELSDIGGPERLLLHQAALQRHREAMLRNDIVHFHFGFEHLPFARDIRHPNVSTAHSPPDQGSYLSANRAHAELSRIALTEQQRAALPELNWVATIGLGLPANLYRPRFERGNYLAMIGRICADKGVAEAIEIARRAKRRLALAGNVFREDAAYFEEFVKPHLESGEVYYVGEIVDAEKQRFFEKAFALLFPSKWPEPFGTAAIEAMACGTPVLAFASGGLPEVVEEGVTGIVVSGVDEAVDRLLEIAFIPREGVRRRFDERFDARLMAERHVELYRKLLSGQAPTHS